MLQRLQPVLCSVFQSADEATKTLHSTGWGHGDSDDVA